jgi:dTDP-glucose pyrophosphorylase
MMDWKRLIIQKDSSIIQAMNQLNEVGYQDGILFVTNDSIFVGTLTDGDIRRGLLKGQSTSDSIDKVTNMNCLKKLETAELTADFIQKCKQNEIKLIPIINIENRLIEIVDFDSLVNVLPINVFLLAGGRGERLMPLTSDTPKPMLHVGTKPIIEINIDRLAKFGVKNFTISVNYLANVIEAYFETGAKKNLKIKYVKEANPLGTIGSITLVTQFEKDFILIMNSDLLTNIDFLDYYNLFRSADADIAIASIPYHIDVPYAIMEVEDYNVINLEEKPRYTYYANAGIYLVKKEVLNLIPKDTFYNATDLIKDAISNNLKIIHYSIRGYWLDIGKITDFKQAQEDIEHIIL